MGKLVKAYLVSASRKKESGNLQLNFSDQESTTTDIDGLEFASGGSNALWGNIRLRHSKTQYVKADGSNLPESWRPLFQQTKKGKLITVDGCIQPVQTGKPFVHAGRSFYLDLSKPTEIPKLKKNGKKMVDRATGEPILHIPKDPKNFKVVAK